MNELSAEKGLPRIVRALGLLDRFLHWSLDRYINRTLPGWEHLQLWQNRVCNAYEHRVDRYVTRPEVPMPDAEKDLPCVHPFVTLVYAGPNARWTCDTCGELFHPVALTCITPPGEGRNG